MGVVAQWQSTGGLSQRPWVQFSFPLPFQRSSDSNRPDYLSLDDRYHSSDLGERHSPHDSFEFTTNSNYRLSNYTHIYIIATYSVYVHV